MIYEWSFDKRGRRIMRTSSTTVRQAPITVRKPRGELEAVEQWISTHPNSGWIFLPSNE